jgi:hypothetical protein
MGITILIGMGLTALLNGLRMLRGGNKAWYFARHLYAGGVYAQIPMGVGVLLVAGSAFVPLNISNILIDVGIGFGLLGVIFNFVPPSFLRPAWLKWLRHEHGDIYHLLEQDAHDMGLDKWERRMQRQEDMEEWVAEVRQKHGLEK